VRGGQVNAEQQQAEYEQIAEGSGATK